MIAHALIVAFVSVSSNPCTAIESTLTSDFWLISTGSPARVDTHGSLNYAAGQPPQSVTQCGARAHALWLVIHTTCVVMPTGNTAAATAAAHAALAAAQDIVISPTPEPFDLHIYGFSLGQKLGLIAAHQASIAGDGPLDVTPILVAVDQEIVWASGQASSSTELPLTLEGVKIGFMGMGVQMGNPTLTLKLAERIDLAMLEDPAVPNEERQAARIGIAMYYAMCQWARDELEIPQPSNDDRTLRSFVASLVQDNDRASIVQLLAVLRNDFYRTTYFDTYEQAHVLLAGPDYAETHYSCLLFAARRSDLLPMDLHLRNGVMRSALTHLTDEDAGDLDFLAPILPDNMTSQTHILSILTPVGLEPQYIEQHCEAIREVIQLVTSQFTRALENWPASGDHAMLWRSFATLLANLENKCTCDLSPTAIPLLYQLSMGTSDESTITYGPQCQIAIQELECLTETTVAVAAFALAPHGAAGHRAATLVLEFLTSRADSEEDRAALDELSVLIASGELDAAAAIAILDRCLSPLISNQRQVQAHRLLAAFYTSVEGKPLGEITGLLTSDTRSAIQRILRLDLWPPLDSVATEGLAVVHQLGATAGGTTKTDSHLASIPRSVRLNDHSDRLARALTTGDSMDAHLFAVALLNYATSSLRDLPDRVSMASKFRSGVPIELDLQSLITSTPSILAATTRAQALARPTVVESNTKLLFDPEVWRLQDDLVAILEQVLPTSVAINPSDGYTVETMRESIELEILRRRVLASNHSLWSVEHDFEAYQQTITELTDILEAASWWESDEPTNNSGDIAAGLLRRHCEDGAFQDHLRWLSMHSLIKERRRMGGELTRLAEFNREEYFRTMGVEASLYCYSAGPFYWIEPATHAEVALKYILHAKTFAADLLHAERHAILYLQHIEPRTYHDYIAAERANSASAGSLRRQLLAHIPSEGFFYQILPQAAEAIQRERSIGQVHIEYFQTTPIDGIGPNGEDYSVPSIVAVVVPIDGPPVYTYLCTVSECEQKVMAYRMLLSEQSKYYDGTTPSRALLSRDELALAKVGRDLRKQILDPLLEDLDSTKMLSIAPDGCLHLVPFAALPTRDTNTLQYLAEATNLQYVRSATDLLPHITRTPNDTGRVAVVSAPTLSFTASRNSTADDTSTTLVAELDTQDLAEIDETNTLGDPGVWPLTTNSHSHATGTDANESAVAHAEGAQFLAIGAHAVHDERLMARDSPFGDSAILLAPSTNPTHERVNGDGILSAYEISLLDFNSLELAVLACCSSAVGPIETGMGTASIRLAFQLAGAHNVVAAQWEIPTAASIQQLTEFTGLIAETERIPIAFSNAQRRTIGELRDTIGSAHPFYWAALHCYTSTPADVNSID